MLWRAFTLAPLRGDVARDLVDVALQARRYDLAVEVLRQSALAPEGIAPTQVRQAPGPYVSADALHAELVSIIQRKDSYALVRHLGDLTKEIEVCRKRIVRLSDTEHDTQYDPIGSRRVSLKRYYFLPAEAPAWTDLRNLVARAPGKTTTSWSYVSDKHKITLIAGDGGWKVGEFLLPGGYDPDECPRK